MTEEAFAATRFKQMPLAGKVRLASVASGFSPAMLAILGIVGLASGGSMTFSAAVAACGLLGLASIALAHRSLAAAIAEPLEEVAESAALLADGEHDVAVAHADRGDQIGDVARALLRIKKAAVHYKQLRDEAQDSRSTHDKLLERLASRFEQDVGRVVGTFASASSQLRLTASTMAEAAEQSSSQTGEVSSAMSNAAAGVTAAAAASDEFAMSINEISRQASSSAQLARKATDAARDADATISKLNDTANEIGQIVGLISSIAQRTNLLALNASIEAARGGEAGRGFAVVASEVKDLAAQTGKATERVAVQIKAIQQGTSASVAALQGIVGQINELEATSVSIAAAVDQQSVAGQDLARSIDLAARSTENVSSTVSQVRQASIATGAAASQVLTSSNELEQQACVLREQVDTFLDGVRRKAA